MCLGNATRLLLQFVAIFCIMCHYQLYIDVRFICMLPMLMNCADCGKAIVVSCSYYESSVQWQYLSCGIIIVN